jgi:antitoxin (DNA-binding transcriptional repressor) of toxin-antitoxin stability system
MKLRNSAKVATDADIAKIQGQLRSAGVKLPGGVPASAFGDPSQDLDATAPAAPAAGQSKLTELEALIDARRGETVNLPVLGAAYLQIVPHGPMNDIESALLAEMQRLQIPPTAVFLDTTWDIERKARILAASARRADDPTHSIPLLPQDFWLGKAGPNKDRGVDDHLIVACFEVYRDVCARLDPIGMGSLTPEHASMIMDAFKKKDGTVLVGFGAVLLTLWLLTGDLQPSSSPTPASSTGT